MPGRRKHTRSIAPAGNSDALIPPGGLLPARPAYPYRSNPDQGAQSGPCPAALVGDGYQIAAGESDQARPLGAGNSRRLPPAASQQHK